MTVELLYTSAIRGLKAGSKGFCTVAATRGIPPLLAEKLESLSAYRVVFPPHDEKRDLNPVNFAYWRFKLAGRTYHVASRVCFAGVDYSKRANKFAHHVVLDPSGLPDGGPGWLLGRRGFLETEWNGEVGLLGEERTVPSGDSAAVRCTRWKESTGDAGWAGVVAGSLIESPARPIFLVFDPQADILSLWREVLGLLSPELRWQATFSTYATNVPKGVECLWRGVLRGSPEEESARAHPRSLVLDVGRSLGSPPQSAYVEAARRGETIVASTRAIESDSDKRVSLRRGSLARNRDSNPEEIDSSDLHPSGGRRGTFPSLIKDRSRLIAIAACVVLLVVLGWLVYRRWDAGETVAVSKPIPEYTGPDLDASPTNVTTKASIEPKERRPRLKPETKSAFDVGPGKEDRAPVAAKDVKTRDKSEAVKVDDGPSESVERPVRHERSDSSPTPNRPRAISYLSTPLPKYPPPQLEVFADPVPYSIPIPGAEDLTFIMVEYGAQQEGEPFELHATKGLAKTPCSLTLVPNGGERETIASLQLQTRHVDFLWSPRLEERLDQLPEAISLSADECRRIMSNCVLEAGKTIVALHVRKDLPALPLGEPGESTPSLDAWEFDKEPFSDGLWPSPKLEIVLKDVSPFTQDSTIWRRLGSSKGVVQAKCRFTSTLSAENQDLVFELSCERNLRRPMNYVFRVEMKPGRSRITKRIAALKKETKKKKNETEEEKKKRRAKEGDLRDWNELLDRCDKARNAKLGFTLCTRVGGYDVAWARFGPKSEESR